MELRKTTRNVRWTISPPRCLKMQARGKRQAKKEPAGPDVRKPCTQTESGSACYFRSRAFRPRHLRQSDGNKEKRHAVDHLCDSGRSVASGYGLVVYAGRIYPYLVAAGDCGCPDPRDPGTKTCIAIRFPERITGGHSRSFPGSRNL